MVYRVSVILMERFCINVYKFNARIYLFFKRLRKSVIDILTSFNIAYSFYTFSALNDHSNFIKVVEFKIVNFYVFNCLLCLCWNCFDLI